MNQEQEDNNKLYKQLFQDIKDCHQIIGQCKTLAILADSDEVSDKAFRAIYKECNKILWDYI